MIIETEIAELKAAFRKQGRAVMLHFAKRPVHKRRPGESIRSAHTRLKADPLLRFYKSVEPLIELYETAPFDEDDARAVIIGHMIVSKAREWELTHIGRSVIPAHVVEFKRSDR